MSEASSRFKGSDLTSVVTAYNLYKGWDYMSPAQKSLAISSLGMQSYRFSTGEDLATYQLIEPKGSIPGLTLGQAFNLFSRGYNAYALTKNWNQLNTIQKTIGGAKAATDIALTAKNFNLLGYGAKNAAIKGVDAAALSSNGWSTASNYGIGAITAPAGSTVPTGYVQLPISGGEGMVVVPEPLLPSAQGALDPAALSSGGSGGGGGAGGASVGAESSPLGAAAGALTFAAGAYQLYQGWGQGGSRGRANGAIGGSMMAAGLYGMGSSGTALAAVGSTNPFVLGAVVAASFLAGSIKAGKSGDQQARDGALSHLIERGAVGKDYKVLLPDGTPIDLGVDGHGNMHSVSNPDKLAPDDKGRASGNKLNWWDTDYTNDLDYWSGTAGTTLTRLMVGGKNKAFDQLGGKIGNGAIQNIGYGKEFTPENFNKWRDNMRSVYSQFGVKSKADGYQLVNQMFAENRIDDSDAVSMHQTLNILYDDNGYNTAQTLSAGRHRGIEASIGDETSDTVSVGGNQPTSTYSAGSPEGEVFTQNSTPQLRPGKNTFDNPPQIVKPTPRPTAQVAPQAAPNRQGWGVNPMMARSKEDIQAQNRAKFNQPQAM